MASRKRNQPLDVKLYQQVKQHADMIYQTPSAYKSGWIVKTYKKLGGRYRGLAPSSRQGLKRWFREKWTNQRGQIGYQNSRDVYRPTIRVTRQTPLTFDELSRREIVQARRQKQLTGRVRRFRP
jgi:hypothetical protein